MSNENLLEHAGRGITSALSGAVSHDGGPQERSRGNEMLGNVGMGGALLGGGTAAVVAALGLLHSLNKEREMEDPTRLDDDTLYISDPNKKHVKAASEGVSPLLAPGLALTGGIVGAGAGYALVQGIWNSIEKRRRQKLLDEAQHDAINTADQEVAKSASAAQPKVNLSDLLTAAPVALPLLTMMATGGITYAALEKYFPTIKRPQSSAPRRIRLGPNNAPLPDDIAADISDKHFRNAAPVEPVEGMKSASVFQHTDLEDAGGEFLASFVAASRKGTITGDFISKAASGELEAMEYLFKSAGIDSLIASLKGAGNRNQPQELRMLGTMALFKSAALKDTVRSIAAAEYLEIYGPSFAETSGCPATMRKMASLGCLMGVISRDSALPGLAKEAASMAGPATSPKLLELLKTLIAHHHSGQRPVAPTAGQPEASAPEQSGMHGDHQQREERDAALNSDAGGGVGGESEEGSSGEDTSSESTGDNDVVDDMMASKKPSDVLKPSA